MWSWNSALCQQPSAQVELCGELFLEEQMGPELSGVFVSTCLCAGGKGLGPQGPEPSNLGRELKKEERTRQVGMQVCTQICVVVFR